MQALRHAWICSGYSPLRRQYSLRSTSLRWALSMTTANFSSLLSSPEATGEQLFIGLTNRVFELSWKLFPKISSDIDYSRQQVITLLKNNTHDKMNCARGGHTESGHNFFGDPFYTDSKLCIILIHG
ncbi:MAG TPA: hypothetical protein ENI62_10475 [Gammaproteobacteria bacterium]|nr:hypothetical protein [Gammaproteobacteria bacterium]